MANEEHAHEDLKALEAALAGLTPRPAALDRDRLMFLAGQAASLSPGTVPSRSSSEHGPRLRVGLVRGWQAAFAGMTSIAAGLLIALLVRPPLVVERIAERPAATPQAGPADGRPGAADRAAVASPARGTADSYVHLRDFVSGPGLEAWPLPAAIAAGGERAAGLLRPSSLGALLDELQERPEASRATRPEISPEFHSRPGEKS